MVSPIGVTNTTKSTHAWQNTQKSPQTMDIPEGKTKYLGRLQLPIYGRLWAQMWGCVIFTESLIGGKDSIAEGGEKLIRRPGDLECKVGTNKHYMFWFWSDLTSWLLGMNFSSEHKNWKHEGSHPPLGYDVQTHGVWTANDLGSEKARR